VIGEKRIRNRLKKLENTSARSIVVLVAGKLRRKANYYLEKLGARSYVGVLSDAAFVRAVKVKGPTEGIVDHFLNRKSPAFFWDEMEIERIRGLILKNFPVSIENNIWKADRVIDHRIDFLGFEERGLGSVIDWQKDVISGYVWPRVFSKDIQKIRFEDNSDIKIPWEISRFHHLTALGKAFLYTGDEKYSLEYAKQVSDWIEKNPCMFGVNWVNAMEAGIRAANLILGFYFFRKAENIPKTIWLAVLKSLLTHGRFIYNNLEQRNVLVDGNVVHLNGNHYIADLVGLVFLGILFPEFEDSRRWARFAIPELWREIETQNNADGVNYEFSIGYHRLVTELCLTAVLLCLRNGIQVPRRVLHRIEQMLEFVASYTKPDGGYPMLGDSDDGVLYHLGVNTVSDHKTLLAVGAVLFGRPYFKALSGGLAEEVLWLQGPKGYGVYNALPKTGVERKSACFKISGFYVMKKEDCFLIISCHDTGISGTGGSHTHNDCLSFELAAFGKTFVADPGTYTYTGSEEWRNRFRRSSSHNTIVIDGEEINRISQGNLFHLENDARPILRRWISSDDFDVFEGEHFGYMRLKTPVTHRRRIIFDKKRKLWMIRDDLLGDGFHRIDAYFHLAKSCCSTAKGNNAALVTLNGDGLVISMTSGEMCMSIEDDYLSPRYGVLEEAKTLHYSGTLKLPSLLRFAIFPNSDDKWGFEGTLDLSAMDGAVELEKELEAGEADL
jgi:hypothetical protein